MKRTKYGFDLLKVNNGRMKFKQNLLTKIEIFLFEKLKIKCIFGHKWKKHISMLDENDVKLICKNCCKEKK